MKASKQKLLRHGTCLVSEKEIVSFVTLFVLPEAEPVKTKKATSTQKMEKKKLYAVLRAFLESIQVYILIFAPAISMPNNALQPSNVMKGLPRRRRIEQIVQ